MHIFHGILARLVIPTSKVLLTNALHNLTPSLRNRMHYIAPKNDSIHYHVRNIPESCESNFTPHRLNNTNNASQLRYLHAILNVRHAMTLMSVEVIINEERGPAMLILFDSFCCYWLTLFRSMARCMLFAMIFHYLNCVGSRQPDITFCIYRF